MFEAWHDDLLPKLAAQGLALGTAFIKGIYSGIRSISLPMPTITFRLETPFPEFPSFKIPSVSLGISWTKLADLIPALAEGGIVTRPTLALLGERGPEAVVPLGDGGLGQIVVNVYGSVLTEGDLIEAIHAGLLRKQGRNASLGWA